MAILFRPDTSLKSELVSEWPQEESGEMGDILNSWSPTRLMGISKVALKTKNNEVPSLKLT